ncbi:hypothetical protein B0G75_1153 [Paraburkholderia sp. BL18I3N2]|nr:hypothetical protein B0G75_1153 [Paraburkholderia sp. BL18I3N2]
MRQRFQGELASNPVQHSKVMRMHCLAEPVVPATTLSYPFRARSRYFRFFSFPKELRTRDATRVCGRDDWAP